VTAGRIAFRFVGPLSLLVLWQVAGMTHVLDTRFFPTPTAVFWNFVDYARSGALAHNALATFSRLIVGLAIGGIPGTALGLAMGMNRWVYAFFQPVFALLYPIPKIAILPLFYIMFGTGEGAKWAAIAVGVFFLMAINTEAGVRQIERIYLDVARAYRLRPLTLFFRVLLPGALPNIFAGLKLSIGIAIVLAVAAEYQLTKSGLGYEIYNAGQLLDVERLYAALVAVSLLGFGLTAAADSLEVLAIPWRRPPRV
jgi:NitT/TauT family transport system permease protein